MKRVSLEKVATFSDERGLVFNPMTMPELNAQQNFHVVTSAPQAIRGNHYHRRGMEILIIVGPALVRVREESELRDIDIPDRSVYRLTIPPGVPHAVKATGSQDGVLLSFNTVDYDPKNPDVVREVLM